MRSPSPSALSRLWNSRPAVPVSLLRSRRFLRFLSVSFRCAAGFWRLPALAGVLTTATHAQSSFPDFHLRTVDTATEFYRETLLAADLDNDGDMDFFSGNGRGGKLWWFEGRDGRWVRHVASDSNLNDVGAALHDFDADGWMDRAASAYWYRNPGFGSWDGNSEPPRFEACRYSDQQYIHDVLVADMDGDERIDIVTIDYDGIRWFRAPPPDSACQGLWQVFAVNGRTLDPQQHGGIAVGDLDGDGDPDISRLDRWFENADGKAETWVEHINIPFGQDYTGGYGQSGRAAIVDMDGDGANDIVQTECDVPNGRVGWFRNADGQGLTWEPHIFKDSVDGQDFHSLALADFDDDGDLDVFSAGASHSASDTTRAYVWENTDGKGGAWVEHILVAGELEIHDAGFADMDGDGDIDVLAKVFGIGSPFLFVNQTVPNGLIPQIDRRRNGRASAQGRLMRSGSKSGPRVYFIREVGGEIKVMTLDGKTLPPLSGSPPRDKAPGK